MDKNELLIVGRDGFVVGKVFNHSPNSYPTAEDTAKEIFNFLTNNVSSQMFRELKYRFQHYKIDKVIK